MTLWAATLALLAGAIFGANVYVQRRGLGQVDPLTGAFLSVGAMSLFFWLLSPLVVEAGWWSRHGTFLFVLGGLFFPAAGQAFQVFSIARVGPALTSAFGAFAPFFAAVPAVLILGEPFGWPLAAGMGLMTAGLLMATLGTRGIDRGWPLWALLLPLAAALARGLAHPITRTGLTDVPSPFFATLVMGTVSTLVLAVLLAGSGRLSGVARTGRGGAWFAASGIINGFGILSLNTALEIGGVTTTSPLVATTPIWALLFGILFFRVERVGLRHAGVAVLVVAGAVLIVTR